MAKVSRVEVKIQAPVRRQRVAAYARVSKSTERLMHSASAQISYYSSLIQKNPEWEYAGVYADCGTTGTLVSGRSEFCRLINDCESGKIDIILCKSISRFARNTVDLLSTIRHLKEMGIEVRFEKEQISSLSGDGELMLSILASFAQEESRSISENVKWGIRKRFKQGEIGIANKHILGYRYDDEQKKYVIIPKEAEAARWMFRMYLEGVTLRDIARSMNKAGIRSTCGNTFQQASVRQLIFNEVYAGDIRRQKCYVEDPITKNKVINRGKLPQYYMTDCHEAIIDRKTYAKVKEEMKRRAALAPPSYCFTKKVKCGICGKNFTRRKSIVKGKEYVSWICRNKKETGITCTSHNYSEEKLQEICADLMETSVFEAEAFEKSVRQLTALEDGSVEMLLCGGEIRRWQMPPKPVRLKTVKAESKRPRNLFDGKIFCGKCGRRFGRAVSDTTDGGHLYWYCRSKSTHGITCDSVNYADSEIRKVCCIVMGMKVFDEECFIKSMERMVVQPSGSIDIHLKDGHVRTFETLKLRSNKHETTITDVFKGKIFCDGCGNAYRLYRCGEKYVYWTCYGKHKVRTECRKKTIRTLIYVRFPHT